MLVALYPPPLRTKKVMDFLFNFYIKITSNRELRTLSQKLRTNPQKIASKQNYEQTSGKCFNASL